MQSVDPGEGRYAGGADVRIRETRVGLVLMMVAAMTLWIPYVQYGGYLLEIAGAVLLMRGRTTLGKEHSSNVATAFYLFMTGTAIETALVASVILTLTYQQAPGPSTVVMVLLLVYMPFLLSIVTSLIFVMPLMRLVTPGVQRLLWIGFGSGVTLGYLSTFGGGVIAFSGVPGLFGYLVAGIFNPSVVLRATPPLYNLTWATLTVIPFGIFAYCTFLARRMLDRNLAWPHFKTSAA